MLCSKKGSINLLPFFLNFKKMATTDLNIKGRVGDITFYKRGDKTIIRLNEGISRHQIKNMPNMINNRLNRREFVACSKTASAIYTNFNKLLIEISLKYRITKNNLVSLLRRVQQDLSYLPLGTRTIQISSVLFNYSFSQILFNDIAKMPIIYKATTTNINIKVPKFNPNLLITAPTGATHYRLIFSIELMENVTYNTTTKNFNRPEIKYKETQYGIYQKLKPPLTVEKFVFFYNYIENCNVILAVGIAFYTENGGLYTNLYTDNGAKILDVFNF